MKDNNIEVFHDQLEAIVRIKELKALDYKEEDMYIISGDDQNISMLRGSTDVMIKEEEGSLFDRFKSFLKGEDSITEAFSRMGLKEADRDFYHNEVKNGKIILYIDKDYGSYYELNKDGLFSPIVSDDEVSKRDVETVKNVSKNIEKDIGIDGNPELSQPADKRNKELIIEEDRKIIR